MSYFWTSESVTRGHPDKVADQIADSILDACLSQDPQSRVACEVLISCGLIILAGEISTKAVLDYHEIVRTLIKEIGYDDPEIGFDYRSSAILNTIHSQSPDIAQGVFKSNEKEQGAGDQGIMFGYACDETAELMPLPIVLAHTLSNELENLRATKKLPYLRPDGKTQVTVEYSNEGAAIGIHSIVISTQHSAEVDHITISKDMAKMVKDVLPKKLLNKRTKLYVNPTGRFVIGGPAADTGLTGRKIIVDTYGGIGKHGGGSFSGKDPSKVDRSGAYVCRYIAKNIVAAKLAKQCEIQISYAIGVAEPLSIKIDTYNTGIIDAERLGQIVAEVFELTPGGIIKMLKLKKPIYKATSYGGHFGRPNFTWEKTDKVKALLAAYKRYQKC